MKQFCNEVSKFSQGFFLNHGLFNFNQTYSPITRRNISKRLIITRVSNNIFKNCLNLHISNKLNILNKYANGTLKRTEATLWENTGVPLLSDIWIIK